MLLKCTCSCRSLAWEGTNSHNCGLIISSIKTNSTKEISNHDQVTLDLGRLPQACYLGDSGKRDLRKKEVSIEELEYAQNALGEFGGNNRTGIAGTLHRISAIRNKNGRVVGLTCRLGRPVREIIDMTRDLLEYGKSILFLGRYQRISLHSQSKLQYMDTDVDFQMQLGPEIARKIILERRSAPAFPFLIEMRERDYWVAHRGTPLLWKQIGLNSWRRSSTRRIRTATEETLRQFCCCTFVLLLPLRFAPAASAPAAAVLLLLLLHFASADADYSAAAAAFRPAAAAATLCCVLLLLQLRFANAAAVFCCCCSLLRGSNPMVLTGLRIGSLHYSNSFFFASECY
ncbi:UNVERIFIED_CONTAM: putative protein ycf45 [Sesamum radiatum]|uniref:Uncharacterized protein n=1 Tax=Sesamum radiatum TaxID=300843 RepID=A0AAW2M5S4_SESRA